MSPALRLAANHTTLSRWGVQVGERAWKYRPPQLPATLASKETADFREPCHAPQILPCPLPPLPLGSRRPGRSQQEVRLQDQAANKKFVFKIKTKSGGIVGNIVIDAKDIEAAKVKLGMRYPECEILEGREK
jgi:hypothetical protein